MTFDIPITSLDQILDRYEAVFLDAYGVLVHDTGPIPGAAQLIDRLESDGRPYFVLTNDASRSPAECSERYGRFGVSIPTTRIISSGSLIGEHFVENGLRSPRAIVLGGPSARTYVASLGARIVTPSPEAEFDVIIPCGMKGYDFLDQLDDTLSALFRALDNDRAVHLLLPNPDVIYPRGTRAFGFTAGGIALMLESALEVRSPGHGPRFVSLGKPGAPIFEAAIERAKTSNAVMIGDQLGTDIAGARAAGIDAVLVTTGVAATPRRADLDPACAPTWLLHSLELR